MRSKSLQRTAEHIRNTKSFLVTSHVNPEGDAIGSLLAMGSLLEKLGKRYVLVNADKVPDNMLFLPGVSSIKNFVPEGFSPQTVIVLDCPTAARCGNVTEYLSPVETVINIDHHVSNDRFGDVNWVEPSSSSVGEMVFKLAKEMGVEMDKPMAEQIYTAIVTDTGMFSYSNTKPETHRAAAGLLGAKVDHVSIHRQIFETRSFHHVVLLGRVLATMDTACGGRVAHISLMHQMCKDIDIDGIPTDEFISFPRSVQKVEVALFFKEFSSAGDSIKVSFRSNGRVDVNLIASRFGGGGHRLAAGCTIEGSLEAVKKDAIAQVERELKECFEQG